MKRWETMHWWPYVCGWDKSIRCWETKHWCHTKPRCSDYFSIIDLGIISTLLQVSLARSQRFLRSFCALRRWPSSDHRCLCRATRLSILSPTVWRYLPMSPQSRPAEPIEGGRLLVSPTFPRRQALDPEDDRSTAIPAWCKLVFAYPIATTAILQKISSKLLGS